MKTKTKKITFACVAALLMTCICFSAIWLFKTNAKAQTVFKENYLLGETIQIPEQHINVNGTDIAAKFLVENPNGVVSSASSQELNAAGKWKVLYYANHEGETKTLQETFNVQIPLVSFTSEQDVAEYKKAPLNENVQGLVVNLSSGSEMTVNSVIDLKAISGKTEFISFFVMPQKMGQKDFGKIKLVLEDVNKEDNYIEITVNEAITDSKTGAVGTFVKARASTQNYPYAYEYGLDCARQDLINIKGGYGLDAVYGFYTNSSFTGENFGNQAYAIRLGYDYLTKTLYCFNGGSSSSGNHVISFDNPVFVQKWEGFSSDFVRLKISGDTYESTSAGIVINSINGVDIYKSTVDSSALTTINVDYGKFFTADNYPNAIVGKPYKIFNASANSIYTKETISVNVYTGYGSSTMTTVPVENGCFIPQNAYVHTIVYTCTDAFGNKTYLRLPVGVNATANSISFNVDKSPITISAGEYFSIPQISNVTGYAGEYYQYAKIIYADGSELDVSDLSEAKPEIVGNSKLVITVKDYVQNETSVEIPLTVNPSAAPIFVDEPVLPVRYIVGGKYQVPALYVDDYSSGKLERINCSVKIYADGLDKEIVQQNGYFSPSGNVVKFLYEATDKNGVKVQKEYSVATVDVGFNSSIDKSKYFIAENGVVAENNSYVTFTASNVSTASAAFVNSVYGSAFSFEFFVDSEKADFESIDFILSEIEHPNKKVLFTVGKTDDGVAMLSANGTTVTSSEKAAFTGHNLQLSLDGKSIKLANNSLPIEKYTDGSVFNGFNGYVNCSVILNNVGQSAEVRFIELFGQIMMKQPKDLTKPSVVIFGDRLKEASLNQIVSIGAATAFDVLNPYTSLNLTVLSPSGEILTSEDGIQLKGVDTTREYSVKFTEYGKYSIEYSAIDGANNKRSTKFFITCVDSLAPQILVNVEPLSAKVNQEISIPEYTVVDNCTATENIMIMIHVINNEGVLSTCAEGKFTPNAAGVWKIRIVAVDESFNMAYREIECIVE